MVDNMAQHMNLEYSFSKNKTVPMHSSEFLLDCLVFSEVQAQTVGAEERYILVEAITDIDADVVFMRHALAPDLEIRIIFITEAMATDPTKLDGLRRLKSV